MSRVGTSEYMKKLHETGQLSANDVLTELNRPDCKEVLCVACSGGSDSVYLFKYLIEKFSNIKQRLVVLHFNHNLRGEDSDGDEKFVESLSKEVGVKFYSEKLATRPKIISEDALRAARNDFFARAMLKFVAKILVLGQQKNDIAETLLMRLTRASDTAGLSAPREVSIWADGTVRVRPLLHLAKSEIEERLAARGEKWREDKSNFENDFLRNKIRNIVLPQLQKVVPGYHIIENFAVAKKNIEQADDAITFFANKYLSGRSLYQKMDVSDFLDLPVAVLKKIFVKFFEANDIDVRKTCLNFVLDGVLAGRTFVISVGINKSLKFDGKFLFLGVKAEQNAWAVKNINFGDNIMPNLRTLRVEEIELTEQLRGNLKNIDVAKQCFLVCPCTRNFSAKNYEPSYNYIRFGHKSPKRLGDVLTSKILKNSYKADLPVIFLNGEICWVPNLPVVDSFKIKESDKKALLLTYF